MTPMSDVTCSRGFGLRLAFRTWTCDLVTRVDALSSLEMSLLLILIPFEETPHLTADFNTNL